MEILFELLLSFLGELVLPLVGEILAEFGLQSVAEPFKRQPRPWVAALGYAVFGALVGGFSLLVLPNHLLGSHGLQVVSVALSPVVAGFGMAALGAWRAKRGQRVLRIDRFSYGYVFALAFGLVRFAFAA